MASEGPLSPTIGANDSSVGATTWINNVSGSSTSAQLIDGIGAAGGNGVFAGGTTQTYYLVATGFGFAIPSGSTIDGIVVEARNQGSDGGSGGVTDYRARIVKGGSIGSTDRSLAGEWGSLSYKTYSSDLWGESWSPADINASNFGFAISANDPAGTTGVIDHIRITVYYTEGGGAGAASTFRRRTYQRNRVGTLLRM